MIVLLVLAVMALSGCAGTPVVDLGPVGYGLSLIGIAIVLSSLVRSISDHWPGKNNRRNRHDRRNQ